MRIARIALLLLAALPLLAGEVLDNAEVERLVAAGLSPDLIVLKIERTASQFDTSTDGLVALKKAGVPDKVIRAMLLKTEPAPAATPAPSAEPAESAPLAAGAPPAAPPPAAVCATLQFYTLGTDGMGWVPSYVCVGKTSVSVDEQTIPFADVVVHCMSRPPSLEFGGTLFHGPQEWWLGDKTETMKFRGRNEDLDRIADALTQEQSHIRYGPCNERELRRLFVKP